MTFYKIKHISIKSDGMILFDIGKSMEVYKHASGRFYIASTGDEVTPLYDSITDDIVGFCADRITFEE